jgi:GNAT superfamily N-acetyltransferase/nitroimidazol reductase NimA-like FMN-containing flavoprotein (pyridoxamine 5'-phosphate oxidase superfamily)
MRKAIYRMECGEALELLAGSKVVQIASTTPDGAPVLRTVHGVVVDGGLCFHGAPVGEKAETVGRPAVANVEEIVAEIPSYFVDPERACPATTYFRSAQVHAILEPVEDPAAKARALAALMAKYQPEGGHVPIDESHPLYRKAVAGILIVRLALDDVTGKGKLGQNRSPEERKVILERMWARGREADPRAIEIVRAANPDPIDPDFLRAPDGARLSCALDARALPEAVAMLRDTYWNRVHSDDAIARAHLGATAWVGAHDAGGKLIATARALSDGGKWGWIYDVVVLPEWRGRGLGSALVRLLLDHPRLRDVADIRLGTRDAQEVYRRLGFVEVSSLPEKGYPTTEMSLRRARLAPASRAVSALGG